MSSRATRRLASITTILHPRTTTTTTPHTSSPIPGQQTTRSTSTSTSSQPKKKSAAMESSLHPPTGLYKPNSLKALYYGPNTVNQHLLSCLPTETSKAFIITGNSLATKTPLIKQIEDLLQTRSAHAGTFSNIRQHAPVADLDKATSAVLDDDTIDTIISVGGGSPIDSAKAISYRYHEKSGKNEFLNHICIPTTLSAAECTFLAGYTESSGVKTSVVHPSLYPNYVLYDSKFALHTPPHLFMTTGVRALDHATELQYYPTTTLVPARAMALHAVGQLFTYLPRYKADPKHEEVILTLYLAAYASLGFLGANMKGGLGLSHTLGYALGSPYGIPHGVTSCITLGHVVKLKAEADPKDAAAVAGILPVLGEKRSGDDVADARKVGDRILALVDELGFKTTLTEKGVGRDQVDVIVQRCTGGKMPEGITAKVRELVETLY